MLENLILGVVGMNLFALALTVARGPVYHTRVYRPMLVNLALSVAPLLVLAVGFLAFVLTAAAPSWVPAAVAVLVGLVWLLLLPNAGYLVTELNLSHRRDGEQVPMWFDVVLVITLAMSGVLNTALNVFLVQLGYVLARYGDVAAPLRGADATALVAGILLLVSFGMYLGRYVRLNSWDVRHPASLAGKVLRHLRAPQALGNAIGFTLLHAAFLGLMYVVVAGPVITALIALEARTAG